MTAVTLLSGGVGGARAARGFLAALPGGALTVVVNVGDDDRMYGVHVSADLDTVAYTLADREGPEGWGIVGDTFHAMEALSAIGEDTTFRLGDADLATCLYRTRALDSGVPLSQVTRSIAEALGIPAALLPATDDRLRTRLRTVEGEWLSFQDYFVARGHRDRLDRILYEGAESSKPAPGVLEAVGGADVVVIGPSNPPLSIHPILAVPGIREAVADHARVAAISPLFGGAALKGPAAEVMDALGYPAGTAGVLAAYAGLITDLVIDEQDAADVARHGGDVRIHATDTRVKQASAAARLASFILDL